eukprot:gene3128-biopygen411
MGIKSITLAAGLSYGKDSRACYLWDTQVCEAEFARPKFWQAQLPGLVRRGIIFGDIPGCKAHWGWLDLHLMQRMVQASWPAPPGAPCDARWRNRRRPPSTSLPPPLSTNDSTASIDDAASGDDATDLNKIHAQA